MGGLHSGVVPGHVVIAQVVGQNQKDVGTASLVSCDSLLFNVILANGATDQFGER